MFNFGQILPMTWKKIPLVSIIALNCAFGTVAAFQWILMVIE